MYIFRLKWIGLKVYLKEKKTQNYEMMGLGEQAAAAAQANSALTHDWEQTGSTKEQQLEDLKKRLKDGTPVEQKQTEIEYHKLAYQLYPLIRREQYSAELEKMNKELEELKQIEELTSLLLKSGSGYTAESARAKIAVMIQHYMTEGNTRAQAVKKSVDLVNQAAIAKSFSQGSAQEGGKKKSKKSKKSKRTKSKKLKKSKKSKKSKRTKLKK
jgi:hypothetical protein